MNNQGGHFQFCLPVPSLSLSKVFADIKTMQKDNLSDMPIESKDQKQEEQIKGLKFIAKKIKILLEKNKKIQYNEASRILINNFASQQKAERNIKRRVYDAINVLVSAGVITKDDTKIELVNQKKHSSKNSRNSNAKYKLTELGETIDSTNERISKKKQKLAQVKQKLILLNKIFSQKTRKIRKEHQNQECLVFQWKGNIEEVTMAKRKGNIVIKGGKLQGKHKDLIQFLWSAEMKKKQNAQD